LKDVINSTSKNSKSPDIKLHSMRKTRTLIKTKNKNSMLYWTAIKNPLRICINYIVISLCRILPSLSLKRWFLRRIGAKIGNNVSFGLESTIDVFFPELVEIGDNTIIGYRTSILTHEFLVDELRIGEVKIGENVMIGANCTILPGITIGDNAVISAHSLVNKDIPENVLAGGVPVEVIKTIESKRL